MTRYDGLGVPLHADTLAELVTEAVDRRVLAEVGKRREDGPAFRSEPFREFARRLRQLSVGAHLPPASSTPADRLDCTEFALVWGRDPGTVRRWAASGRIPGAHKIGGTWFVPADARPPEDRRKRTCER